MAKTNLWKTCYDGTAKKTMPEPLFRQTFCMVCRNVDCELSRGAQTQWQARIETQVDRLLDNPTFADPDDPAFAGIRAIDFPSMFKQAMALEISAQRGDWEIPSQTDAVQLATTGRVVVPDNVPDSPHEESDTSHMGESDTQQGSPEPEVLWQGRVKGDSGTRYMVSCTRTGEQTPVWECNCPSFQYERDSEGPGVCKHIRWVQGSVGGDPAPVEVAETQVEPPPIAQAEPSSPSRQPTNPVPPSRNKMAEPGPRNTPFIPRMQNTPVPSEGLMVGGAERPAPPEPTAQSTGDPWAAPTPPPDNVVPVGSKVRMGLTGKTKKDS